MTDGITAAPADEAGVIVTADTATQVSDNDALGAVYDRLERDNGAGRSTDGRFASNSPQDGDTGQTDGTNDPLEGGTGEEATGAETPPLATGVPLPATLTGLDEDWSKLPPETQERIAANQQKLHKTLSEQGRFVAAYRPVGEVFNEFKEYFGGEMGNHKPDEAVRYLFGLQRSMDEKPMETLLQIADTYELRPILQQMFGGQAADGDGTAPTPTDNNQALLAEISELKRTISGLADPSKIDQRITAKFDEEKMISEGNEIFRRTSKDMPLYSDVEAELLHFIPKGWAKLGDTASPDAVLKLAYDMAVNADPDLRKKAAALASAAQSDPKAVENARKANATNIRSTSTGKARELTEEEELANIWDKHKRA